MTADGFRALRHLPGPEDGPRLVAAVAWLHRHFDPAQAAGARACPFTTLYWDFLDRHRAALVANQRMALQVKNLARLPAAQLAAIRAQAAALRQNGGQPGDSAGSFTLSSA